MRIVHTYVNNMKIHERDFASKWGLIDQAKKGHEVILLCGSDSKDRTEYITKGIKVIELPYLWKLNTTTKLVKGFCKELKLLNADVIHSHHYGFLIPELTALTAKLQHKAVFLTIHSEFKEGNILRKTLNFFYVLWMQAFFRLYDKVFFISNWVNNSWLFKGINRSKKEITYNKVPHPPILEIKKDKELLYIGRISAEKGIDLILYALSQLKHKNIIIQLTLIGSGTKAYEEKIKDLCMRLKILTQVNFVGNKIGIEKWTAFYSHKALIVPSRQEAFGNVAIEGMLCKIPLIISNKGALQEVTGNHANVFSSIDELTKILTQIFVNSEKLDKQVDQAYQFAKRYTSDSLAKQTITEYEKAIAHKKAQMHQ